MTTAAASRWPTRPARPCERRATGGSYLSGRLGDGDKASVTYTIETLTPTPAPPPPPPLVLAPIPDPPRRRSRRSSIHRRRPRRSPTS